MNETTEYPRDVSTGLPLCDQCHQPVAKGDGEVWRHHYTADYHGPCWWGKPWPFGVKTRGWEQ